MPEGMKSQVLQPRAPENLFVEVYRGVGKAHPAGLTRREHPRIVRMPVILGLQQIDHVLHDGDFADGVGGFGPDDFDLAAVAVRLPGHGDGFALRSLPGSATSSPLRMPIESSG